VKRMRHRSQLMSECLHTIRLGAVVAMLLAFAGPAAALQPLAEFADSAAACSTDNREARALAEQLRAQAAGAWGRVLPGVSAQAVYTRNQYESVARVPDGAGGLREAVIVAENQRDLFLTLSVPLVDVGGWMSISSASRDADAGDRRAEAVALDVERAVARAYFDVVAFEALLRAAERTLEASRKSFEDIVTRKEAGVANELDLKRAAAEIERNAQSLQDAELAVELARRALETTSGLRPSFGETAPIATTTVAAVELTELESLVGTLPAIAAADAEISAREAEARAAWSALVPSISARGTERFTNAVGFGEAPYWTLSVSADWAFDGTTVTNIRARGAAVEVARARAERARNSALDQIHAAFHRARAVVVKARAARAQLDASVLAA
jgi:outer membrane protein TolC